MRKFLFLILGMIFVVNGITFAQSVTVDATIDSLQILIGEQAKIRLQVSLDADKRAIFPIYRDTLVSGVEILDVAKTDTQMLNGGRRALLIQEYTVTSFDSALYYLPPMQVQVDNKSYYSKALALKVYSVPVDTLHPENFFGPKDIMSSPFVWADWYMVIACVLLFSPFLLLLIYLIKRIRDNEPIIRKVKVEPQLPPHQLAMQQIEHIKEDPIILKLFKIDINDYVIYVRDIDTGDIQLLNSNDYIIVVKTMNMIKEKQKSLSIRKEKISAKEITNIYDNVSVAIQKLRESGTMTI